MTKNSTEISSYLFEHHRTMLEQESGIRPDVITARGYETVTSKAELKRRGFSPAQQNVPALLIPIFSPTGDVVLYQARPDTARINKGKPVKYETPTGSSMALDVHPFAKDKVSDPNTPLFVTEGVKKGDALVTHGLCAVALIGVWNWRGKNEHGGKTALPEWEFVALNDRRVYIVFDSDVMLKKEVHAALVRLKGTLEHRGAKVAFIYLPTGDGATKAGVDDYLAAGHSTDDLLALATSEVRGLEVDDSAERAGPYLIKRGSICQEKDTRDGPVTTALCNFNARITEQRERDDGVERTLTFVITGELASGRALPEAEINAPQFAAMNWPVAEWGTQAVVYAGQGTKDHLRTAIQMFSGDAPRRTTYTHLGWREVGGRNYFLHAGGVIAPVAPQVPLSVQVEPPGGLEPFVLPDPPTGDDLKRAVRSSLATLDLAPDPITVPLLGMVYRSVLDDVDFGGHLAGQTGAGKSELAAVMQQHFGAGLDARNLPGSWSSTANALEGLAFAGKDVLITVDDFAPEGSSYDIQRYHATAARLFRAQGNNAARGRMRADGSLRPNKPPRGLILSTGEDIPKGHSIKARTLILELEPNTLNWQRVTEAQKLAASGVYASAMSGFIGWLAADYPGRVATFKTDHATYRNQLQSTGHKRTVDAGAQLLATYRTLLTFALGVGALDQDKHSALWGRLSAGIRAALEPQANLQAQSDPVARFSELLTGLFVSGRAHVASATSSDYPGDGWGWETFEVNTQYGPELKQRAKGNRIGWIDGSDLYLESAATYAELQKFARDQGDSVPVTERTLWKRLNERGMILSREEPHMTVKRSFAGAGRVRVLHLTSTPYITGASGANGESVVQDGTDARPTAENDKTELGQVGQPESRQGQRPTSASQISGADSTSGADKSASETAQTPQAPLAPVNTGVGTAPQKTLRGMPAEVEELHRRFKAGELKGVPLKIPGGNIPDLEKALTYYFDKKNPTDAERHDLLEMAQAIVGECETVVL